MTFHFRLLRRSVYESVGGLDVRYERAEDYDLCLRLSEVTEIRCVPKPLYFYRQHSGNMTNDESEQIWWSYQAFRFCCEILNKLGLTHQTTPVKMTLEGDR